MRASLSAAAGLLLLARGSAAIDVDLSDSQSIIDAAKTIAAGVMALYPGEEEGGIPGLLSEPYYFWEAGLLWDNMVRYSALTGDESYDDVIQRALLFQKAETDDYMPANQSKSLGNDDQSYWALAAMTAQEYGFALPEDSGVDSWFELAKNVFDEQVLRWDTKTCDGGLRWQIYSFNNGYDYKNSISQGNLMQLAARLYAYNGNETYREWWTEVRDWSSKAGLYDNSTGRVFDGTSTDDCENLNHLQWTANVGTYLASYAYMVNAVSSQPSHIRTPTRKLLPRPYILTMSSQTNGDQDAAPISTLWSGSKVFTEDDVLQEVACESGDTCNVDQRAFKGVLATALANVRDLAAGSNDTLSSGITDVLEASAKAAAASCSGRSKGGDVQCGLAWTSDEFDDNTGVGQHLNALSVMLALLPSKALASSDSPSNSTSTSGSSNGTSSSGGSSSEGSSGSSGADGSSGEEAGAPAQQGANGAENTAASMFGLLGAIGFAVAFYL